MTGPQRAADSTHACPGRCGRIGVPRHKLACRDCWHRLPVDLRHRISYTWSRADGAAHMAALTEAVAHWGEAT